MQSKPYEKMFLISEDEYFVLKNKRFTDIDPQPYETDIDDDDNDDDDDDPSVGGGGGESGDNPPPGGGEGGRGDDPSKMNEDIEPPKTNEDIEPPIVSETPIVQKTIVESDLQSPNLQTVISKLKRTFPMTEVLKNIYQKSLEMEQ